jgi:hypothetical protein
VKPTQVPSHVSNSKFIARLADITHSKVQPYVLKLIRDHGNLVARYHPGSSAEVEKSMRGAMDRIWRVVVDLDGGGVNANDNDNHNADAWEPLYANEYPIGMMPHQVYHCN